jgi:anti-anti-sigma factor
MADLGTADAAQMRTEVVEEGGVPVVKLTGELDLSTVDSVRSAIAPVLEAEPNRIDFDLSALEFMDSSGIALMLSVSNSVPEVNLRHPTDIIRQVIEITGLTEALHII